MKIQKIHRIDEHDGKIIYEECEMDVIESLRGNLMCVIESLRGNLLKKINYNVNFLIEAF